MGRSSFTHAEIEELRRLIREKQTADRSRPKTLRARMRRMDFYISDFTADSSGFVVSDLDELIARGVITLADSEEDFASTRPSPRAGRTEVARLDRGQGARSVLKTPADNDRLKAHVRDALRALERGRARPIAEAAVRVPRRPGLYAIHATPAVWEELGLGAPPDKRPLYIGKSESSLAGRDVTTHFGFIAPTRTTSVTGYSTVRRSLAALLRDSHGFRGIPRNPEKPGQYANYGLSRKQDELLSDWMRKRLRLAVWPKPPECAAPLLDVESAVLRRTLPPLNVDKVVTPWKSRVDSAREVLRLEARKRGQRRVAHAHDLLRAELLTDTPE